MRSGREHIGDYQVKKTTLTDEAVRTSLQKELALARNENKKLLAEIGRGQIFIDRLVSSVHAEEPFPKLLLNPGKAGPDIPLVIKFSDWQIGEVTNIKETEGFGQFNWEIAQKRVYSIMQDILQWAAVMQKIYQINECHVFCEGDFISGDIHDELRRTNEFPLPVQTEKAGLLLGEMFVILASRFKKVIVWEVAGDNHGRLTIKTQFKQRALNNMNHLVYVIANAKASKCNNLIVKGTEGIKMLAEVGGFKILIEHGNDCKGWMGIPYYGISRMVGREGKKRMRTTEGFDYNSIGHFHVPAVVEGTIFVNGSLTGTNELDEACGRHALPSQCAFLMSRKHGWFSYSAFRGNV